jgi:hypothetical protein
VIAASPISISGNDVLSIFEMEQCPHLLVALQDYVSSTSSVSSIGTAFSSQTITIKMRGSGSTMARAETNLYVINKILF